ncbi:MAG: hypothetical protein U9R29_05210 [Thermodesulfobacteriota bacterium]|nr:hypothetical protein [Thermodesulfobacteriota bacterium]
MTSGEASFADWEALCQRCGQCCYEKVDYRGKIYITNIPCEYLDPVKKQCLVYRERCLRKEGCVVLTPEIVAMGVLPMGCAYVRHVKNYSAPLDWEDFPVSVRGSLGQ